MKLRLAASSAVLALATIGGLFTAAGTASAATGGDNCRNPIYADGLDVQSCIAGDGGNTLTASAFTWGSNNTSVTLCAEVVDSSQNVVAGSRNCAVVWGPNGAVYSNPVSLPPGTYYGVSYFTSPTFYYGGETGAEYVW